MELNKTVYIFSKGLARVKIKGKDGVIDKKGLNTGMIKWKQNLKTRKPFLRMCLIIWEETKNYKNKTCKLQVVCRKKNELKRLVATTLLFKALTYQQDADLTKKINGTEYPLSIL
nr:hypothetical protein [uncultured Flavobacterium sp.]